MRRRSRQRRRPRLIQLEFKTMQQTITDRAVLVPPVGLSGDLIVPEGATGVVLFAHGSGSSRHSTRNRYVAGIFQQGGLATLLLDLLTTAEEQVDLRTR